MRACYWGKGGVQVVSIVLFPNKNLNVLNVVTAPPSTDKKTNNIRNTHLLSLTKEIRFCRRQGLLCKVTAVVNGEN